MILIITTEEGDFSHPQIINWLIYRKAKYIIITGEEIVMNKKCITIKNGNFYYDGINLTDEISCVYYRRWLVPANFRLTNDSTLNDTLLQNLFYEAKEIRDFLFSNLESKVWIPNLKYLSVNKLNVLEKAKEIGFNIPDYIVTNQKKELVNFYNNYNKDIICKAIGNYSKIYTDNGSIINTIYTKTIDDKLIKKLPDIFFISLFQKRITKLLELRVLYFNNKTYPIGVMSQENELTKFDSRKNSESIESRLVPINIPRSLTQKINKLMKTLNLNIGSLDFILDDNNDYYFLEVNPVGQIGGYSRRTTYNIEKQIIDYLIDLDYNYEKTKK
ncbi:MAG: gwsG [Bacteroidetes bacterium]|nr:gwsG [Bacteroidota bacterium]